MYTNLWEKCVEFHGHECPGLAIGFKAAVTAMKELNTDFSSDEEIVCITENDACGVDAIQVITGCTLGKGNLLYKDLGKQAFNFFCRKSGKSLRLVLKSKTQDMGRKERQKYILESPAKKIFEFKKTTIPLPENARIFDTVLCEVCHEGTAEHRIRLMKGKKVCLDCFENYSRGW